MCEASAHAIAGSGGRSLLKRPVSSSAKCIASHSDPPLPQTRTLFPARKPSASSDASGHGGEVAGVAKRLRGLMRRYMNYVDQRRLAEGINREFAALDTEGRFATALVGTFWTPTGEVELTNAGHPRPLLYRAKTRK